MTDESTGLGVGARLPRKEDARFLRGRGKYVADVHVPGTMEVAEEIASTSDVLGIERHDLEILVRAVVYLQR